MLTDEEAAEVLNNEERMYAPIEMAHIVKLNKETIQRMCRDGRIKAGKQGSMWRISKTEVKRFIQYGPRSGEEIVHNG